MKTYTSILLLWALACSAQADDTGISAGQSAMAARAIAYANVVQPPQQTQVQVYQGNGQQAVGAGGGSNMSLSIGSYYGNGTGQPPRENIVSVGNVIQVCENCSSNGR